MNLGQDIRFGPLLGRSAAMRRVARDKVAPRADAIDRTAEYPSDMYALMKELGLFTLPPEFKFIGQGSIGVIPFVIVIFVVFVIVFDLLLRRSTAFRKVFYTGSNEKAAAYSGIRTKRVIFFTTVLCSTLCGVAGVIYMARFGSAQPTFGIGMELNVIAAAVIGGASLSGGQGTIFGAILGAILLSVVSSSLALLDVSVYWQDIIRGSILLAAVSFDYYLHKRKAM